MEGEDLNAFRQWLAEKRSGTTSAAAAAAAGPSAANLEPLAPPPLPAIIRRIPNKNPNPRNDIHRQLSRNSSDESFTPPTAAMLSKRRRQSIGGRSNSINPITNAKYVQQLSQMRDMLDTLLEVACVPEDTSHVFDELPASEPTSLTLMQAIAQNHIMAVLELVKSYSHVDQVEVRDVHGRSALQLLTRAFVDLSTWITREQEEELGGPDKVTDLFMAAIIRMVELGADVNYCSEPRVMSKRSGKQHLDRELYIPSAFFKAVDGVELELVQNMVQICARRPLATATTSARERADKASKARRSSTSSGNSSSATNINHQSTGDPLERLGQLANPNTLCFIIKEGRLEKMTAWQHAIEKNQLTLLNSIVEAQKEAELIVRDDFNDCVNVDYVQEMYLSDWRVDHESPKWITHGSPVIFAIKEANTEADILAMLDILLQDRPTDVDSGNFMTLFNPNAVNERMQTMLHVACERGHTKIVPILMSYCMHHRETFGWQVDVNMVDELERTALMIAIEEGHESTVAELFNRSNLHFSPAVDQNTRMVLNGLTDSYMTVQPQNEEAELAAAAAASSEGVASGHEASAYAKQQLHRQHQRQKQRMSKLDHRMHNLNLRSSYLDFTVLHYACSNAAELNEAVKILCQHKANVNLFDRNGFTPLHLASMLGHITVVKYLLMYNANPSSKLLMGVPDGGGLPNSATRFRFRFSRGEMPLHLAAGNGHINVVRELLHSGAEVATENEDGCTPLHFAFEYQSNLSALDMQGQSNAMTSMVPRVRKAFPFNGHERSNALEQLESFARNPDFHQVAQSNQDMLIKLLLDNGANLEHEDKDGHAAFVNEARELWFHQHKEQMTQIFDHPLEKGYDSEIFVDKRTQAAVKTMWLSTGQHCRAYMKLLAWLVFTSVTSAVVVMYSGRGNMQTFSFEAGMRERMTGEEWDTYEFKTFEEIATIEEWNLYLQGPFVQSLFESNHAYHDADGKLSFTNPGSALVNGFAGIVGQPRYRQIRTRPDSCLLSNPSVIEETDHACFKGASTAVFGGLAETVEYRVDFNCSDLHFQFQKRPGVLIAGKYGNYNGDGYGVALPKDMNASRTLFQELETCHFVSLNTRAAIIEFTLYVRSEALFTQVFLYLEQTTSGSISVGSQWQTLKLVSYATDSDYWRIAIEAVFVLMLMFYLRREYRQYCETWDPIHVANGTTYRWCYPLIKHTKLAKARKLMEPNKFGIYTSSSGFSLCWVRSSKAIRPYLVSAFNYVDVLLICLCLAVMLAHGLAVTEEWDLTERLAEVSKLGPVTAQESAANLAPAKDINLSHMLRLVIARQHLFATILFLCYIKCLEYIQVNEDLAIPVIVIQGMLEKLASFFLIFLIFLMAFTMFNYALYGMAYESTSTIFKALVHSFRSSLGDVDFDGLQEVDPIVGVIMGTVASFLLVILLLNLLVAIMNEAYEDVKETAEARWCYEQFRMIVAQWRRDHDKVFKASAVRAGIAHFTAQQRVAPLTVHKSRTNLHEGGGGGGGNER